MKLEPFMSVETMGDYYSATWITHVLPT